MNIKKKYNSDGLLEAVIAGLSEYNELEKSGLVIGSHFVIRDHVREFITQEIYKCLDGEIIDVDCIFKLLNRLIR